jgi:hypothetical protein
MYTIEVTKRLQQPEVTDVHGYLCTSTSKLKIMAGVGGGEGCFRRVDRMWIKEGCDEYRKGLRSKLAMSKDEG